MWPLPNHMTMRMSMRSPDWRILAMTSQLLGRSLSLEGSRRLWGDWMNIWKKRYNSFIHICWIYMAAQSEAGRKIPEIYPENKKHPKIQKRKTIQFLYNMSWLRWFICFLSIGMGVSLWEAADVSKLLTSQHHRPQPLRHFWLPVCTLVLVEADRGLSGGECPRSVTTLGVAFNWFLLRKVSKVIS